MKRNLILLEYIHHPHHQVCASLPDTHGNPHCGKDQAFKCLQLLSASAVWFTSMLCTSQCHTPGWGGWADPWDSDEIHLSTHGDSDMTVLTLGNSAIEFCNKHGCGPWGMCGF